MTDYGHLTKTHGAEICTFFLFNQICQVRFANYTNITFLSCKKVALLSVKSRLTQGVRQD